MPTAIRPQIVRALSVSALCLGTALVVSGCTSGTASAPTTSPAVPKPTSSAARLSSTPFDKPCASLAPSSVLEADYPGMVTDTSPAAPSGDAGIVADYDGTVCSWKNSSGKTMTLAVGEFGAASLTSVENRLVTTSNSVPTYGVEGYFDLTKAVGTAEAFPGPYWVVARSDAFAEPGDAQSLLSATIASLTGD